MNEPTYARTPPPATGGDADADGIVQVMSPHAVSGVLDALSDFVCVCIDGDIRHINQPGAVILGAPDRGALLGRPFENFLCDDLAATLGDTLPVLAAETQSTPIRVSGLHGAVSSLDVRVSALPELGDGAYVVVGKNLTLQVELSEAVRQGEQRFSKLVNSALDLICVLEDGVITYINQSGLDLLKAESKEQIVGRPLRDFLHSDYVEMLDGDLAEIADEAMLIPLRLRDLKHNHIDGEMGLTVLKNGDAVRCMIEIRDITATNRAVSALRQSIETLEQRVQERTRELQDEVIERRRAEEMLRHVASHDNLTDLPNRALLMDRLDKALSHAHRDSRKCAVVFIDLDGFKPINDTLGHDMGDLLLREVAVRLTASVRETDTAARFGGDEFVLVLTDLDRVEDVVPVARKVLEMLAAPVDLNGTEVHIGASVGIGVYPDHGMLPSEILKAADDAMYEVKESGKNSYAIAQPKDAADLPSGQTAESGAQAASHT